MDNAGVSSGVMNVSAPAPFFGRTGEGVRIAVIDSGVDAGHPHIDALQIAPGIGIWPDGRFNAAEDATCDRLGHGTAVMAAVQEKAPGAVCLPVRVFHDGMQTSAAALVAAIRWSIMQEVNIINLSLGSINPVHGPVLAAVLEDAARARVVVTAAREVGGAPSYPGALPMVVGVEVDWSMPRARYGIARRGGQGVLITSGYPRAIPGVSLLRNLHGISFAVAQATGFVALALETSGEKNYFSSLEREITY